MTTNKKRADRQSGQPTNQPAGQPTDPASDQPTDTLLPATDSPPVSPDTIAATLALMDDAWARFAAAAEAVPASRLTDHLGAEGWTRKQMLAHIGTWHELTFRRLNDFAMTGEHQPLAEEVDAINARAARAAEGVTAGEVLGNMEASYRRLRRLVEGLSDRQLRDHDGWPAAVIAGNTYGHYAEHAADLEPGEEAAGPPVSSA
jgi:hypothetical protein